ncbi:MULTISPECIES: hypothetical protein [Bacillus]|uniref:hypothetical protein n=1 Tax=Bacillus TaxID=1386 RepID=UPI0009B2225A|nr:MULTISPECIES: hypothetical protein [Bacillus]MDA2035854.1 hypothetical protein [Bacillus cereus]MDA2052362.1 hypothetical protein [Bacillus cereus]MEB5651191.1 hypothetical protein [Bacillus anthracis]OQD35254.1 hypothetical protein B1K97_00712 [Bacillus toyonensis]PGD01464.1 hypothetical protein COM31_21340 [Bacillus toyonensis]
MDFLMDQALLYTSKKYEEIYILFKEKYDIKYQELFVICASIGFKKNKSLKLDGHGREFRTNYLSSKQKATAYSILLSDMELGKNIESFEDSEFRLKARKRLELYAEGGMEILVQEVFGHRWDGNRLDPTYGEYEVDVLSYIYTDANEIPF